MAKDKEPQEERRPDEKKLAQHPYVTRLKRDPASPAQRVRVLAGVLGDSDRTGYRRLYFSRELILYAEFRAEDVVYTEAVPSDQPPFVGLEATRVALRRDATIAFTRAKASQPVDEFDVDIRLGAAQRRPLRVAPDEPETWEAECPGPSFFAPCETDHTCRCGETNQITVCRGATCIDVCDTQTCATLCPERNTCGTCVTRCNQNTCQATCTCATQCNQATCATCQTRCQQQTCQTCATQCEHTCNPHVFTCGPRCL
jgi:hypothetical protein